MEESVGPAFYQAGRAFKDQDWAWASTQMLATVQEIDSVPLTGKTCSAVMSPLTQICGMYRETHLVSNTYSTTV